MSATQPKYTDALKTEKLDKLAEIEGYDSSDELLEANGIDSVVPGICMNAECEYTTEVEGDQDQGHCESCGTGTVVACLVLAGLI
jgi:hypothetical protein